MPARRSLASTSYFGVEEAPTKPRSVSVEDHFGPEPTDLPKPPPVPKQSQKIRKVVVRRVTPVPPVALPPVTERAKATAIMPPPPSPQAPAPPALEAVSFIKPLPSPSDVPVIKLALPPLNEDHAYRDRERAADSDDAIASIIAEEPARATPASPRWRLRIALLAVICGGELALAHQSGTLAVPPAIERAGAIVAGAMHARIPDAPSASATTNANAEWLRDSIPSGMGLVTTTASKPGHQIVVDDRTVGETPQAVLVKCGPATVQVGSTGRARIIDVPCGELIGVEDH